jgi:hypothetical protein
MKTLLEDYKRKLATINQMIANNKNNGSLMDEKRAERYSAKAECYRTFITELERQSALEYPGDRNIHLIQPILKVLMDNTDTEGRYIGGGEEPVIIMFKNSEDCNKEIFLTQIANEIAGALGEAEPKDEQILFGVYSPEEELLSVHRTSGGAEENKESHVKAHGEGFSVDHVVIHP